MSIVTLEGEFIHYEVLGRGRPLFFLHGWVGSWRYWIPTMQVAAISYRSYALDLYGFGDTSKRPDRYTIEQQSNLLNSFMENMGIGRVAVVGHGLGALVALQFVRDYPDLVDRAILTGAPMGSSYINPRLRSARVNELADWLLSKTSANEAARVDASKADQQAITTSFERLDSVNLVERLVGLSTPSLFVYGLNDPAVELPEAELLSRLPECTHQIIFDGSGHFPMLDEPNRFSRLLVDFLALPSGESPRQLQLKGEWKRRIR